MMTSIRLDSKTESTLAEIGARKGLTKSGCIRLALQRFIEAEQAVDPYALLEQARARYEVAGGGRPDRSERHSALIKAKLRAKHRR